MPARETTTDLTAQAPPAQVPPAASVRPAPLPWRTRLALSCLMLGIVAVWGWTFALMKGPIAEYGVVSFLAVRFVIGSAALGLFAARRTNAKGLATGALIGIVLAGCYLFQTFGLRHTTATNTGVITGLFIVFAPLCNRLLFGVRTPATLWAAIGVSVLGLALLTGAGPVRIAMGDLLTLGAAAGFGLHVALLDRYAKRHDAAGLALGQLAAASITFLAIWPFVEPMAWPAPRVWFALLVTGLVATAAGFFVQTLVQRRLSAVETAAIIIVEPVFAAVFGYLLAGDRLTGLQIVGAVLVAGAMIAVEVYPRWAARRRTDERGVGKVSPTESGAEQ